MEKIVTSSTYGRDDLRQFCAHCTGLPESELSEDRILDVAADALWDAGIVYQPIRHYQGTSYYFDETGKYCSAPTAERFPNLIRMTRDGQRRARLWDLGFALKTTTGSSFNVQLWIKAASKFQEGATLRDCLKVYMDTTIHRYLKDMSFAESMVTLISHPSIERAPGTSKGNFDRIRVTVGLTSTKFDSFQDLRKAVIENKQQLHEMVLQKIAESKGFQTYGVPLNILALTSLNLWRDHTLEYIFEPKRLTLEEKIGRAATRPGVNSVAGRNARKEFTHEQDSSHDPCR